MSQSRLPDYKGRQKRMFDFFRSIGINDKARLNAIVSAASQEALVALCLSGDTDNHPFNDRLLG